MIRTLHIGEYFGRWTVIAPAPNRQFQPYSLCRCDCGIEREVQTGALMSGNSKSCGCWREVLWKRTPPKIKHGGYKRPEHRIWRMMRSRCINPKNHKQWKNYGGRGITVCERWDSFANFIADMGPRPSPQHSVDRLDNNGNYEPNNCRWATAKEQGTHKRNTADVNYHGITMRVQDWERHFGVKVGTLRCRLRLGWSFERAVTTPFRPEQRHA